MKKPLKSYTVRIHADTLARLRAISVARETDISTLIRLALDHWISRTRIRRKKGVIE